MESGPLVNEVPVIDRPWLKVCECMIKNGWDVVLLRSLVGDRKLKEILDCLGECKEGADLLVWTPNLNSEFSSKSV